MVRKGYKAELKCRKELERIYGRDNVIKVAIGSFGGDFLVACCGELVKIVEVKEIHNIKNYSPRPNEKKQIERIIKFAKHQRITAEIWIYKFYGVGKPVIKQTKLLYGVKI